MAIVYTALKTELQTDPKALGYAAAMASGQDQVLADKLNAVGASNETVFTGVIPSYMVINATDTGEWAALSAQEKQRFQTLTGAGQVDTGSANVRASFLAMFSASTGPLTRAALTALASRPASRAEALFGAGISVTAADVAQARKS